ncbi:MAG: TonB-dependent siderophore receptor [Acidobacteriota bacterium]
MVAYSLPSSLVRILALTLVGALLSVPATAQTSQISGVVVGPDGERFAGATVRLIDSAGDTVRTTTTDDDGEFVIDGLAPGSYEVRVTTSGFPERARAVRLSEIEGQRIELDLRLPGVQEEVLVRDDLDAEEDYVADRTVTATKTSSPLLEVPQSVSVLTRDRLDTQGVESQAEALRYSAGIVSEPFGPDMLLDWTQIRGFQQYGQNLFRDGFQFRSAGQSALRLNPWGAERIEVVRGPSSALYGQSSVGGFVNFATKRPPAHPLREIRLQAGSYERLQGAFDLGGPVDGDGEVLYRLTGLVRDSEAQVDFSRNDQVFVAPALTWTPGPRTTLTLLADYQHDEAIRGTSFLPAAGTVLPNPHGRIPVDRRDGEPDFDGIDRDQYSVGYLLEHRLGEDWTVRSRARYAAMRNDYQISWGGGLQPDQRTLNRFWFSGDLSLDILTVDHQAHTRVRTGALEHDVLVGVDYQRHVNEEPFEFGTAAPIDVFDPEYGQPLFDPFLTSDIRTTQSQVGLYVQDEISLGSGWRVLAAGRHDWVDTETDDRIAESVTRQDSSAFTGRLGLLYRTEADLSAYGSYSEAFLPVVGTTATGAAFEPERGRQVEVGLKYRPGGGDALLTAAVFDVRRQNVLTPDPDNPVRQVQTGEVRSRGIELEAVANLAGLDVTGALSLLDAEVTESNAGDEGNRPIIVPEISGSLWAGYTIQEGNLEGLGFGAGLRHTGMTYGDAGNTLEVPAYTLVDAAVRYAWQDVELSLNAHNLLDEVYVASCFTATSCFYGSTRTLRTTLRYRW